MGIRAWLVTIFLNGSTYIWLGLKSLKLTRVITSLYLSPIKLVTFRDNFIVFKARIKIEIIVGNNA